MDFNFSLLLIKISKHHQTLLVFMFLILLVFAFRTSIDAKRRGMSAWLWFFGCFFLAPVCIPLFYLKRKSILNKEPKWVPVYANITEFNVRLAQEKLEQHGIESVIMNMRDTNYLFGEIKLYVAENDYNKAIEVLKEHNETTEVQNETATEQDL